MKIVIILVLSLSFLACNRADPNYPFVGKWAGLNQDDYFEAHITPEEIYSHCISPLSRSLIIFSVKGDSLYYHTFEMTVRYQVIADSILVISNSDFSDTLYRMDKTIVTLDEVNKLDTIKLEQYYNAFNKRMISFYNNLGFEDYWDYTSEGRNEMVIEELIIAE